MMQIGQERLSRVSRGLLASLHLQQSGAAALAPQAKIILVGPFQVKKLCQVSDLTKGGGGTSKT